MDESNQSLPKSTDAERSVLGGILLDNGSMDRVRRLLTEQAFYSERHRKVFAALVRLSEAGTALDLVTLKDELVEADALDECGGPVDIAGLIGGVPRSSNVEHYARIIQEKAYKRDVIRLSQGITEAAFNGSTQAELNELIEEFVERLQSDTTSGTGVRATGTELAQIKIALPRSLVVGLIDEGNRGIIFGDAQSGKSLWAFALLTYLAGGFRFAESWDTGKPQKVAMLFFEDRQTPDGGWPPRIPWRYQSILAGLRAQHLDTTEASANILIWCGTHQREAFVAARDHGSKLTVIDSWVNVCTPGEDEYRREGIQRDYDRIHTALGNEAFFMIDHTKKGQGDKADSDPSSLSVRCENWAL